MTDQTRAQMAAILREMVALAAKPSCKTWLISALRKKTLEGAIDVLEEAGASLLDASPRVEVPREELRSAVGLVASERNRWEGHDHKTFTHWERVYTILAGFLLAEDVRADLTPAASPSPATAGPQESAERTLKSICAMLGWDNVPPRRTLEMEIAALKARAQGSSAGPQEVAQANGNDLAVVMQAIRSLDCGALHCRYCRAGQSNHWQHDEHCAYEQSVKDAERARSIVANLRVQMSVRPSSRPSPSVETEKPAGWTCPWCGLCDRRYYEQQIARLVALEAQAAVSQASPSPAQTCATCQHMTSAGECLNADVAAEDVFYPPPGFGCLFHRPVESPESGEIVSAPVVAGEASGSPGRSAAQESSSQSGDLDALLSEADGVLAYDVSTQRLVDRLAAAIRRLQANEARKGLASRP